MIEAGGLEGEEGVGFREGGGGLEDSMGEIGVCGGVCCKEVVLGDLAG